MAHLWTPFHPLSTILAPVATGTADSRLGRANVGRYERVERELDGVQASVAHRDFNGARSGSGEARREAGHGAVSTAAFRPGLEKNGSGWSYGRVELALRGANGCGVLGGAAGGSLVAWKGARRTNSGSTGSSSASGFRGKRDFPRRLGVLSSQCPACSG